MSIMHPLFGRVRFIIQLRIKLFQSEFFALMIKTEMIDSPQYKLGFLGVSVYGALELFCDNKSF